jgi:hypothetical protein
MTDTDAWERVGRELAAAAVDETRRELDRALRDLSEALRRGEEITPQHVDAVRDAINHTQHVTEERITPLAGVEAWDRCFDRAPAGAIWKVLGYRPTDGEPIES